MKHPSLLARVLLVVAGTGVALGAAELLLGANPPRHPFPGLPYVADPVLGWRPPRWPDPKREVDVAVFGDSLAAGALVAPREAWPRVLARRTGWRVANYAVPGYGFDQMILAYRELRPKARVVLFAMIPHDIERCGMSRFAVSKPYLSSWADGRYVFQPPRVVREWKLGRLWSQAIGQSIVLTGVSASDASVALCALLPENGIVVEYRNGDFSFPNLPAPIINCGRIPENGLFDEPVPWRHANAEGQRWIAECVAIREGALRPQVPLVP